MADVINLISSDDEHVPIPKRRRTFFPAPKPDPHPLSDDNEDILIVSHVVRGTQPSDLAKRTPSPPPPPAARKTHKKARVPEAVECVGERKGVQALVDYPHFRFQCVVEPFKNMRANRKLRYCERCFCYVCDVPAADCRFWTEHSKAVDSKPVWRVEREQRLNSRRQREASDPVARSRVTARHETLVPIRATIDRHSSPDSDSDCVPVLISADESDHMQVESTFDDAEALMGECSIQPDTFIMKQMGRVLDETDANAVKEWDTRAAMTRSFPSITTRR